MRGSQAELQSRRERERDRDRDRERKRERETSKGILLFTANDARERLDFTQR